MYLHEARKDQRVEYTQPNKPPEEKLPSCIPSKGQGTILSVTSYALLVKWDNGGVELVHADDVEEVQDV